MRNVAVVGLLVLAAVVACTPRPTQTDGIDPSRSSPTATTASQTRRRASPTRPPNSLARAPSWTLRAVAWMLRAWSSTCRPGAVDAADRITVAIGAPIGIVEGPYATELGGRPIRVEHDQALAQPLTLSWQVPELTEAQRATLVLAKWNPKSGAWEPRDVSPSWSGDVLTAKVQEFSDWSWWANFGQGTGGVSRYPGRGSELHAGLASAMGSGHGRSRRRSRRRGHPSVLRARQGRASHRAGGQQPASRYSAEYSRLAALVPFGCTRADAGARIGARCPTFSAYDETLLIYSGGSAVGSQSLGQCPEITPRSTNSYSCFGTTRLGTVRVDISGGVNITVSGYAQPLNAEFTLLPQADPDGATTKKLLARFTDVVSKAKLPVSFS